jgi:hypothetical protein
LGALTQGPGTHTIYTRFVVTFVHCTFVMRLLSDSLHKITAVYATLIISRQKARIRLDSGLCSFCLMYGSRSVILERETVKPPVQLRICELEASYKQLKICYLSQSAAPFHRCIPLHRNCEATSNRLKTGSLREMAAQGNSSDCETAAFRLIREQDRPYKKPYK